MIALVIATKGRQSLFRNDAEFFWLVARDPFSDGAVFRPFAHEMGDAYRYGRILFPLVAWVLALGRESLVQWTLIAVDVVCFGATVALAGELVARRGVDVGRGVVVLLVPAMWFALVLAVSEPLVLTLLLLAYLLAIDGRRTALVVTAALLLLAREAAIVGLLPVIIRDVRERRVRALGGWVLAAVPLVAWWTWVWARVGDWPFRDPSISRREALSAPFAGVVTVVREGVDGDHLLAFALGALTVAGGIWLARSRPLWPVSEGALCFSLLILFLGANAWRYPGEAIRLLGPAQVLIALTLAVPARVGARQPTVR